MSSVTFSQAKDAELAWIDGEIHFSSSTSKSILGQEESMDSEDTSDGVPVLDVLPQTLVGCTQYQLTPVWDSNAIFYLDQRPFKCVRKSTSIN